MLAKAVNQTPQKPVAVSAPDPAATLEADLKAVAEVARDAARLSPDDHAGRRAIETRIAALKARLDPEGKISDDSEELDSVFSSPSPLEGEGGRRKPDG